MATIANEIAVAEKPILNKTWLASAFLIYAVFYAWVRYYEGVYGELLAA
jgi:methane/ammonia monooxygenase subunit C